MCPNTKNPDVAREFNELVQATSEAAAYHIWSLNNGNAIDKAPNGAESKLFQTLLEHYNGDRVKAIQAKAKVYGSSFIKWFGDWTGNATYEVYQGRTSEIDDRRYNYWSRYENDAKSYGPNVRKVRIDPSGFLFKREQRWRTNLNGERVFDWSWSEEYEKVMAEFKEKTGHDHFDILDNSKEGLKKQNEFFEFLESKGYKGYAEFNELELTEEHDNPYTVTFGDNGIIDSEVSKVVDENGEPLVVWHGGAIGIRIFRHSTNENSTTGTGHYIDPKTQEKIPTDSERTIFFSSNRFVGTSYASLYGIQYFMHLQVLAKDILWNSNADGIHFSHSEFKRGIDDMYEFLDQASEFNPRFLSLKEYIKKLKSENRRLTNKREIEEIKKMVKELYNKLDDYTARWLMNKSEWEYVYNRAIRLIDEYNNPDGIKRLINGEIPETIKKEWELYKKIEQQREKEGKSKIVNYEELHVTLGEDRFYIVYDGNSLRLWTPDYSDPKISEMTEEQLSQFLTRAKYSAQAGIEDLNNNDYYRAIKDKSQEYPVYLNIKNPLAHDYEGTHQGQGYKESQKYPFGYIAARQVNKAIKDGNDGVVYQNLYDPYLADNYGVFNPNQIKSIDNQGPTPWEGTYSRENNDIYHSINAEQWYYDLVNLAEELVIKRRSISLKNFNNIHGTNFQYSSKNRDSLRRNKKPTVRGVNISNVNDKVVDSNIVNKQILLQYLTQKFGLQYKIVDDGVYSHGISADPASNCCIRGNIVYIKESAAAKVTQEQFIEEFLHPLVHNVYQTNKELSQKLLNEAKKDFPDLVRQITGLYKEYGENIINEEIIAQVLSKYLSQEISKSGFNNRNLINYIKNFFQEIFDNFKDLFGEIDIDYISNTKMFTLNGRNIKDVLNYKEFAELINSKQIVFDDRLGLSDIRHHLNVQNVSDVVAPPLKQQLEWKKADLQGEIRKLQDKINTLERNFIRKIPGKNMVLSTPYGDLASTYGFIDNNARSIFGSVSARFKMNKNNVESSLLFPSKWMFTPDNNYTRLKNSLRSNQPQIAYNLLEYLKLQGFNRVYNDWQLEHKVLDTQIPDVDLGVMGLGMFLEMSEKHASDELIEEFDQLYGKNAGQMLSVEKRPDPNDEKATQFRVSANIDELQSKIKQNNPEVRVSNDYINLIKSTQDTSHERSEEDKQMARSEIEKLVEQQREYAKQIAEIEEQIREEQNKEFKEWQEYLKTLGEGLEESCALPF